MTQADAVVVETVSSKIFTISSNTGPNPFRDHILPLAYEHTSLLHAILGLSACHIPQETISSPHTAALEHKLSAIQALASLLLKEECLGLSPIEEDLTLTIVLLLLLQDVSVNNWRDRGKYAYIFRFASPACPHMELISMVWSSCVRESLLETKRRSLSELSSWQLWHGEPFNAYG